VCFLSDAFKNDTGDQSYSRASSSGFKEQTICDYVTHAVQVGHTAVSELCRVDGDTHEFGINAH
jgi:hypothetical protein